MAGTAAGWVPSPKATKVLPARKAMNAKAAKGAHPRAIAPPPPMAPKGKAAGGGPKHVFIHHSYAPKPPAPPPPPQPPRQSTITHVSSPPPPPPPYYTQLPGAKAASGIPTDIVFITGMALVIVNGLSNGQLQEIWDLIYNGKIIASNSKTGGLKVISGEVLFVMIMSFFSQLNDAAGGLILMLFVALWILWIINNGDRVRETMSFFNGDTAVFGTPPPAKNPLVFGGPPPAPRVTSLPI